MFNSDVLIVLWFITLYIVGAWAYFRGARRQLQECARLRRRGQKLTTEEWSRRADISKRRGIR